MTSKITEIFCCFFAHLLARSRWCTWRLLVRGTFWRHCWWGWGPQSAGACPQRSRRGRRWRWSWTSAGGRWRHSRELGSQGGSSDKREPDGYSKLDKTCRIKTKKKRPTHGYRVKTVKSLIKSCLPFEIHSPKLFFTSEKSLVRSVFN